MVEALDQMILDALPGSVYFVNPDGAITRWNQAAAEATGYGPEEVLGAPCPKSLMSFIDGDLGTMCCDRCPVQEAMRTGVSQCHDMLLHGKDGQRIPVKLTAKPLYDGEKLLGAFSTLLPLSTATEDSVEDLTNMAITDELTGLYNRRYAEAEIATKIREVKIHGSLYALMSVDIDDFSFFNNIYSAAMGDAILQEISKVIMANIRKPDFFFRYGGEEFVGLFGIKAEEDMLVVAEKIRTKIEKTILPGKQQPIGVTASIGVTMIHPDDTFLSLMNRADRLLEKSKQNGKNCSRVG